MPQSFHSIALVGNAKDLRVAECMLSLAGHFYARGQRALVDPGVGLAFPPDSVVPCPEQSFATRADLIIAIGGDGTLLYAARLVAGQFGAAARHQSRPARLPHRRQPPVDAGGRRYGARRPLQRGSPLAPGGAAGAARRAARSAPSP